MKQFIICILFSSLTSIIAQQFTIVDIFTNMPIESGGVPFTMGMAGNPDTPNVFFLSQHEKSIYFHDMNNGEVYVVENYDTQRMKSIPVKTWKDPKFRGMLFFDYILPISEHIFIGISPPAFNIIDNYENVLYRDSNYENRDYSAWPHPIGSHVFYYDENNQVRCVDLEGNNLNVQEAHKVLLAYNDALPAAEKAAMTGWHRSSLGSTGAIILGDRYYQSSLYEMLSYFKNVYGRDSSSEIKYPKSNQFLGFDHFHNGYWVSLNSNTEEMLYVFSRQGELIFQKNYVPDVKLPVYPNVIRLHLARESGNIYAMQTDAKEGTIVYKMNHAWGRPNMLAIAINGMGGDTAYDEYVKKTLSVFSKAELRLQRNHLFALYGYVFNSADLKAYFETQNWYEPDPSVTSSVDYLTDAQKQLFEFIRELETGM